jgi:hypothetical protein
MDELIDYCIKDSYQRERLKSTVTPKNKFEICTELYETYIAPMRSFCMPIPPVNASFDIKDGYYKMDFDDMELIRAGIRKLRGALAIAEDQRRLGNDFWEVVQHALESIELGKLRLFIRLSLIIMNWDKHAKIIFLLNYKKPMAKLYEILKDHDAVLLESKLNEKKRQELIDRFNIPNHRGGARIFISSVALSSYGISLHDTDGRFPRVMFINPNYSIISLIQGLYRIFRTGIKGVAIGRFVMCKEPDCIETSMLRRIAAKCKFMNRIKPSVLKDIKYPGEYPKYIEE